MRRLRKPSAADSAQATAASDALLQLAWRDIRGWTESNVGNVPAGERALAAGASAADLATAMNAAAYEAVFALLSVLDEGADPDGSAGEGEVARSWGVVALPGQMTLEGLHEELLMADPTGREGADLFE